MFPSATFPVFSFSIQAGDSLLIYTDGLTEARNATGEEYGLKRVHALADGHRTKPPAELISNCLADLHTFTAGSKQSDDLTLLALQRAA
jgi:sigma-B regulation protein RsbU (phosphoserine phosphatase)